MKKTLLLALMLCGLSAVAQESTTLEKLNMKKYEDISNEIIAENARLKEQLKLLDEQSTQSINELRGVIISANRKKFLSNAAHLERRYNAGQDIIYHIIKETNTFNASFSLLVLQVQFDELIDPTTYSQFNTALNATLDLLGDRKPIPDANNVQALKNEIPALINPLISTSVSIASFFMAKYHKKKDLEQENFKAMTCVLSFTTDTKKDYDILTARLLSLSSRLNEFNSYSKDFFKDYLLEIGYENAFNMDNYPMNIETIKAVRTNYFKQLKMEATTIGLNFNPNDYNSKIYYQIEQVKFLLNEYELILREIGSFLDEYEKFIHATQKRGESVCTNFAAETESTFKQINNQFQVVRKNFNTVFKQNAIPTYLKRNLFGFN